MGFLTCKSGSITNLPDEEFALVDQCSVQLICDLHWTYDIQPKPGRLPARSGGDFRPAILVRS